MPTIDNWRAMREHINWCKEWDLPISIEKIGDVTALLDERDRLATDAQNCKELIWALARELKCLPSTFSDANGHVLKAAIALNAERDRLAAEVEALRADAANAQHPTRADLVAALEFYAAGHHFVQHQPECWDTVSGEPANFQEDEAGTATVEDGSIAKATLAGTCHAEHFADEGEGGFHIDAARGIKEGGAV